MRLALSYLDLRPLNASLCLHPRSQSCPLPQHIPNTPRDRLYQAVQLGTISWTIQCRLSLTNRTQPHLPRQKVPGQPPPGAEGAGREEVQQPTGNLQGCRAQSTWSQDPSHMLQQLDKQRKLHNPPTLTPRYPHLRTRMERPCHGCKRLQPYSPQSQKSLSSVREDILTTNWSCRHVPEQWTP